MTADEYEAHVRSLGLTVEVIAGKDGKSYSVARNLVLPKGALKGRRCDVAIERNGSVPFVPPAAIHTRPPLVRMDGNEPLKTMKSGIGEEWQYWSRRFDRPPTPKSLWAHILTVLCDERWPIN